MKVHILQGRGGRHFLLRCEHFWYPVILARTFIADLGIQVKFFDRFCADLCNCDVLILSSPVYDLRNANDEAYERALAELADLKNKVPSLVWFDPHESSGQTEFEVLPYVSRYLKRHLLRDRNLYRQELYGGRLFTDYYHRMFGVKDDHHQRLPMPLPPGEENKLGISWNLGLLEFRRGNNFQLLFNAVGDFIESHLRDRHRIQFSDPNGPKSVDVMALFNTFYRRETVGFQRKLALEKLNVLQGKGFLCSGQKVKPVQFKQMLSDAKIVVSLFGIGEVCYREFEAFLAGAAVVMPDMSHMETWPDVYLANETYAPVRWDLSNLVETVQSLLQDDKRRVEMARRAQNVYLPHWSIEGKQAFALRFKQLLDM